MQKPQPYSGSEPFIFISYSHKDDTAVHTVISRMQRDGYRAWYDKGVDPGTEWDEMIANKIETCSYFIAFISENYLSSENCKDELNFARDLDKKRLLVYLEDVTLPAGMRMRLNRLQAIFKHKYTDENEFFEELYKAENIDKFRSAPQNQAVRHKAQAAPKTKESTLASTENAAALLPTYCAAVQEMNNAKTTEDFAKAQALFDALGNYSDAEELAQKCKEKHLALKEIERLAKLDRDYKSAVKLMNEAKTVAQITAALNQFEAFENYADSKALAQECKKRLLPIKREEDYKTAIEIMNNAKTVSDLEKARAIFLGLGAYRNSQEKAGFCLDKIKTVNQALERNSIISEINALEKQASEVTGLFADKKRKKLRKKIADLKSQL